jgi:hypothetical protein
MPNRISITLFFAVAIAIVTLFAVSEVLAQDTNPCHGVIAGPDYSYFDCNDFKFEFLGCDYVEASDESTCSWMGTQLGAPEISHLSITLRPDLVDSIKRYACDFGTCNMEEILDGTGDPSTKIYGRFLGLALLKFSGDFPDDLGSESKVSVTFDGRVGTEIGAAFVKSGNCYVLNDKAYCDDSAFGAVEVVGEYCEATIAGIGSTGGCASIADIPAGTIYMAYERLENGCDVDGDSLRLYINSPNCDDEDECDGTPSTYQNGCDYGAPVIGCAPSDEYPDGSPICFDTALIPGLECAQPGSNCPECMEVQTGSPTCINYKLPDGTRYRACFLDDGTTCLYARCCRDGEISARCGY